ncbi:MAG TPA: TadE family type IV pilus minor pilin [Segeticoccus sp.]|nr:TadE family type IV pilus minor pilin [Segeticoccus sp.]
MALPAVVLFLAAVLSGVAAAIDQVQCVDAARAAARAASRGDPPGVVREIAERVAPDGARVRVARATYVTVTVRSPTPVAGDLLPAGWQPHATAVAQPETGEHRATSGVGTR